MKIERHCGVVRNTGSRVFVVWRELPEDTAHALVIYRDSLPDAYSGSVQELVLGRGQSSIDLFEVIDKVGVIENSNMLNFLHRRGFLKKVPVASIDMHTGGSQKISLTELNKIINEKKKNEVDKVNDYNPLDKSEKTQEETDGVVRNLIQQAQEFDKKSKELYARAKNLNSDIELPDSKEISEGSVTKDGKVVFLIDPYSSQSSEMARMKKIHADAKKEASTR